MSETVYVGLIILMLCIGVGLGIAFYLGGRQPTTRLILGAKYWGIAVLVVMFVSATVVRKPESPTPPAKVTHEVVYTNPVGVTARWAPDDAPSWNSAGFWIFQVGPETVYTPIQGTVVTRKLVKVKE